MNDLEKLINPAIQIAQKAGEELLRFHKKDYRSENKADGSIVTEADYVSDKVLREELSKLSPNIPIVTEETIDNFKDIDLSNKTYWCVDPLDGTKIFKNNGDEFSVLIALIENQKPVLGINHAPVLNKTYYAIKEYGAFVIDHDKNQKTRLKINFNERQPLIGLVYKNHGNTGAAKEKIQKSFKNITEIIEKNTALQHMSVANNKTHIFCEFSEIAGEWDVAANQIILEEAGGCLCNHRGENIEYGKPYQTRTSHVGLSHPNLKEYLK